MNNCANTSLNWVNDSLQILFFIAFWATADFIVDQISTRLSFILVNSSDVKDKAATQKKAPVALTKTEQELTQNHHTQENDKTVVSNENLSDKMVPPATSQDDAVNLTRRKFRRSVWKCVNEMSLVIYGFVSLSREEWAYDKNRLFDNWPHPPPDSMRIYYLLEIAHYIYASLMLKYEPKQSDARLMLSHHIATLILLSGSYCHSHYRIGVMVLILTDISDPILDIAKVTKYMAYHQVSDHLFTIFAIVFLISRLVVYPYLILIPAWYSNVPYAMYFTVLLIFLQILFVIWSSIILQIAYSLARGLTITDTRDEE